MISVYRLVPANAINSFRASLLTLMARYLWHCPRRDTLTSSRQYKIGTSHYRDPTRSRRKAAPVTSTESSGWPEEKSYRRFMSLTDEDRSQELQLLPFQAEHVASRGLRLLSSRGPCARLKLESEERYIYMHTYTYIFSYSNYLRIIPRAIRKKKDLSSCKRIGTE